ncbi:MAG: L-ribulose-5-phosphate 3-epimerase [Corynebacterium matruchotii]|uniref:L-ribulose-5-phosphate 3-epimerase n=1 Tax=Corynebacterium matruchotii TaxID=43768 RepID=UPI00361F0CDE
MMNNRGKTNLHAEAKRIRHRTRRQHIHKRVGYFGVFNLVDNVLWRIASDVEVLDGGIRAPIPKLTTRNCKHPSNTLLNIPHPIRTIQLAGYDVYYEAQDDGTIERFTEGMQWATALAASNGVMLAVEIMDTAFMNSISRWKQWDELVASPWFTVYPDVGNLSAWGNDVPAELALGIDRIAAIHLKDTYPVTATSKGQFRDVPFGDGCVDFVKVFQTLARLNYRGAFLIEMWTEKAAEPVAEIIHARRWMEEQMQKGGFPC